ncbi:Anthranilate synthase, aminase component [Acidisarcina polymorpha]|uniref:Anthranilate synthase component 1 n=1 Tax=Acidisarcina polymorpha TaxID=2211140 RepID=A0A2Z5G738_9BACT|nr:anthranilate synthase component I [Acidisarcina polymorpha]AXC14514.1 Anthranilate synthase, aminase component [Acidisarcina polymorpha]
MAVSPHSQPPTLPARTDFESLAKTHNLVPVYRSLTADLETPVSAFLHLAADEPECFMFESVEGGERVGRYTFIGIRPYKKIVACGTLIEVTEAGKTTSFDGDVFKLLKDALSGQSAARVAGLPPFTAGAVGFFAYDVVRQIEQLPATAQDDLGMPDACLMFFDEVLAFDHVRKAILLIVTADLSRMKPKAAYLDAVARLDRLEKKLAQPLPKPKRRKALGKLTVKASSRKKDFLAAVTASKEYIAAGDIFQVVLSQRFEVEPDVDPFSIYRSLRIVNPSPYMYFLRVGLKKPAPDGKPTKSKPEPTYIIGSSPELLVRVKQRNVEYRPIAGTRPRSLDEDEDRRIGEELLADEKERAEHVMLVDLGRNDVGRVSEFSTVHVKDFMFIERYSHVMHLVSAIEGKLRDELTPVDAFRACFPAGTLSGAPKIRAMEIIEELEPTRRGIYGGSILYADFSGNLDSCIAIRTLLLKGKKGYIQAGAGIVADSVPEKEFEESVNKAKAVVTAIERARG